MPNPATGTTALSITFEYNNLIGVLKKLIVELKKGYSGQRKSEAWRIFRNSSPPFDGASRWSTGSMMRRAAPERAPLGPGEFIEGLISGEVVHTQYGEHFETEKLWERHRRHGSVHFGSGGTARGPAGPAFRRSYRARAPGKWAFLDTETTGLGSGTFGTCCSSSAWGRSRPPVSACASSSCAITARLAPVAPGGVPGAVRRPDHLQRQGL